MPRGGPAPEMTGQTFNRLRVLSRSGSTAAGLALWRCLCDPELGGCGTVVPAVRAADLRNGTTASCGCRQRDAVAAWTRTAAGRRHVRSLHRPIWPKVCPVCRSEFLGTSRQVYDSPECRLRAKRSRRLT